MMDIPPYLLDQIRAGRVILFLGSGASRGASSPTAPFSPPIGTELGDLLADKFLGGQAKDKSLSIIAEYSIASSDVFTVQSYVRDIFAPFKPSASQLKIPEFRWAALVTTNYDQIIESAYAANTRRLQTPVPLLRNRDRVDYELRAPDRVALIKLHGCISLTNDNQHPLILTIDQYVTHRKNRDKLFARLTEYAGEYTFVFVGYRLEDSDIRTILLELASPDMSRPRHYVVMPRPSDLDKLVWETKNISTMNGSFDDFISTIDAAIPAAYRALSPTTSQHPISAKVTSHTALTAGTLAFLQADVTYVHAGMSSDSADARAFYKGASYGWSAIIAALDSARTLTETMLSEIVVLDESDRPRQSDLYLLKGYAGAGKTVVLKRLIYEIGTSFGLIALFIKANARLSADAMEELCRLTNERIFVVIDGAARRAAEVESFVRTVRSRHLRLTMILAERTNEWNTECQDLSTLIDDEFELRSLSASEIDALIKKLEQHDALGVLKGKTPLQRRQAFLEYADRQLLVAMYEVTNGKSFPDIVFDEYRNIVSDRAKRIYLVICTLNRLGVPVRAGLIHRVCGISFREFKEELFLPLESIVLTEEYKPALDMAYRSRHPWIAQIVFERALPAELDRFGIYMEFLQALDIGFSADRTAFREMVRAKNILSLFPDPRLAQELFTVASRAYEADGYLFQQRAIYEMKRDNGSLERAYDLLTRAKELMPHDRSILHSMSELEMIRARSARTGIERHRHLEQAERFARLLTGASADSSHGHATLVKLAMEEFRVALLGGDATEDDIAGLAKAVEDSLSEGLKRFQSDEFLLTAEAEYSLLLRDNERAIKSLERAFKINPASAFVAKSLARAYEAAGRFLEARETLTKARDLVPYEKTLNASLGRLIDRHFPLETQESEACWRRSFTSGDTNYAFQLSYGRRLYLNEKKEEANAVFSRLKSARVSRDVRARISDWIREDGAIKKFTGIVVRREENYAWVRPTGQSLTIHLRSAEVDLARWSSLRTGDSIDFAIGFNYMGPAASPSRLEKDFDP